VTRLALLGLALSLLPSCIHAPDVIIVDRKTALEQLATGTYRQLEDQLESAATPPRPEPLTRSETESAGVSALAQEETDRSEAAQLDELLKRRCVGEALDGTIAVTADVCRGRVDAAERARLVERVNRDRYQIWRELQTRGLPKGKERDLGKVRKAWRDAHLRAVVCGGQVQQSGGGWEDKKC
jgi:hypothetical protein